jgi:Uma2 family endonuclease
MSQALESPSPYRFTRAEYHRMADAAVFRDQRVELLEGEIIAMSPQSSRHAAVVMRAPRALTRVLGDTFDVRAQVPLALDERSEPEPDIAVCTRRADGYLDGHPRAADTLLVIEVADSSLPYDRGRKVTVYARAGIPACAILNLRDRRCELLERPDVAKDAWQVQRILGPDDGLPLPGGASVPLADLLPL